MKTIVLKKTDIPMKKDQVERGSYVVVGHDETFRICPLIEIVLGINQTIYPGEEIEINIDSIIKRRTTDESIDHETPQANLI